MGRDQWAALLKANRNEKELIASLYLLRIPCVVIRLNEAWNEKNSIGQDRQLKIFLHGGAFVISGGARDVPWQNVHMHRVRGGVRISPTKFTHLDLDDLYDRSSCFRICTHGAAPGILERHVSGDSSHGETDTRLAWVTKMFIPAD